MFSKISNFILTIGIIVSISPGQGWADIQMPSIFGDNMVLQQQTRVNIWGNATPGEKIEVRLGPESAQARVNRSGKWLVSIASPQAGGPYTMTVSGKNTLSYSNISVGEVWLCSGQSNMEWKLINTENGKQVVANANHPDIRLFMVAPQTALKPIDHLKGRWEPCTPDSAANFSGVAYYFGKFLSQKRQVPIGLIQCAWGGPPVEAWTSLSTIASHDERYAPLNELWTKLIKQYPNREKRYKRKIKKWHEKARRAVAQGKVPPHKPKPPLGPDDPSRPANLFNGMLAPLIPYTIKGVIWYQGEANATRGYQYRHLFPLMIKDWRDQWRQGDFPFLFVQLPAYKAHKSEPTESLWAELREAQAMALKLPQTGMAVTIDLGDEKSMHPKDKESVGWRLSLLAEAIAYKDKSIIYSGPVLSTYTIKEGRFFIKFDHVGSGLMLKGATTVNGFAIAGADRRFVWARAEITKDLTVMVWHPDIPEPVAVRYAWQKNPQCNLFNSAGLPAAPFRTDDWPEISEKNILPVWIKD